MAGETVTVACKLPNGLALRVFNMVDKDEHVMGGGVKTVKVAQEIADRVILNGWSHPQNHGSVHQIEGGFALTPGVDKQFWDKWLEQNKESDVVRNGLVFAHANTNSAASASRERKDVRSGMERLDPAKLPMKGIKTDDTRKAA